MKIFHVLIDHKINIGQNTVNIESGRIILSIHFLNLFNNIKLLMLIKLYTFHSIKRIFYNFTLKKC